MPDWNTRLAVYLDDSETALTPIDSFTPSFALNAEPLHSIEQTHIGVVYNPRSITFTMTVKAIGPAVGQLTALAMRGDRFKVALEYDRPGIDSDEGTNDWSFDSVVLEDCIITSASPSPATISGAPAATFSGMSLSASATPTGGSALTIP